MIVGESWLREWVNPRWDTAELVSRLTMAGLEVKGVHTVARPFSGIIVGAVERVEPHPDADRLRVCSVSDGTRRHQVVCGAPNVRCGMKAPFATVGAEIINPEGDKPISIKAVRLRGVESGGMLCSAEELGLAAGTAEADGLLELPTDAPVGEDLRNYLQLDDCSIELDLTPDRGDCLSLHGVAREVAVLARSPLTVPAMPVVPALHDEEFPVMITAPEQCPRYLGRVIRNIDQQVQVPLWMQEKLRRCGLRSIDPIVDVTNYVLLELGQPMHAFDYRKLRGHINVRTAIAGEKITLLNGNAVAMTESTLVIADAEQPVAMAGVMGGLNTAVSPGTRDVFLECACFAPSAIAGPARSYAMHTDASHRYERGVDPDLPHRAMERATTLLLQLVGGEAGPVTEALGKLPAPGQLVLRYQSIVRLLGIDIAPAEVEDLLTRLGFAIAGKTADEWVVDVPGFRFDVRIEADLIAELARIHGYDQIPATAGMVTRKFAQCTENRLELARIRDHLVALGYQEIIAYSFIDEAFARQLTGSDDTMLALQNPIAEDMGVMRPSLLPGLLRTAMHNAKRRQTRIRLFETGSIFQQDGGEILQIPRLGALVTGSRKPQNWHDEAVLSDFYDIKGDVETLAGLGGKQAGFAFRPARQRPFHPGQCAELVTADGTVAGVLGILHPAIQRELGLETVVGLFELDLASLTEARIPHVAPVSKFPTVSRDLAIVVDQAVAAGSIVAVLQEHAGGYLADCRIFDVYHGDGVEQGKKSVAVNLTWQHPLRTLDEGYINQVISNCVNALQQQFNANLRN